MVICQATKPLPHILATSIVDECTLYFHPIFVIRIASVLQLHVVMNDSFRSFG